ncbi:glycoside hydrolase family 78 protein [Mangrovibacterium diazotrophicum]|uniref:alpha-L-rhamnosidase n=1 Tax=Mangrovibacterium diazotrophicum TaxID=1261403 RepID=A0A419W300_9BACT|nr:glycoside hydrolase family 78 protein [Mangrovibacterium diazotrophicum]RKD89838.1 alpha-L-rhamnosidase [Mangrovibacterium diazotrophicum]
MKITKFWTKHWLFVLLLAGLSIPALAKTEVTNLVCEYHVNPIGLDVHQPRLSWKLLSDDTDVMQTAYEIRVTDGSANGDLLWTSGKVDSDQSVNLVYEGPELKSGQRVYWQVRVWDQNGKASTWSDTAFWEMGLLSPSVWTAFWITGDMVMKNAKERPSPYLRKEFPVAKKVKSARVYVTALGLYELYLNGQKVSADLFTPGWTSYNKRLQSQTYDVTGMLQSQNTIGAILGDGWYRGNIAWRGNNYFGDQIALLCQLRIEYTDGTSEIVKSDDSWKVATGPIISSDIYNGETYNANLEILGWASAGFDDAKWQPAAVIDYTKETLIAPQGEVVKVCDEIKPLKLITTPKGEIVFDMGQNMVGWVQLKAEGVKGDTITLKFAEVLDKDGNFYTANLRAAKATDKFILKGEGEETFEPHFTFHGFRYVQLIGYKKEAELSMITGKVIHSDMKPSGSFSCSNPLINQLQHNIQWGQKGNFLDVPTDCPQRDERLGWTGDAQVFSMTAAFNYNVAAFFTKWLGDVAADQLPSGAVPHVIPDVLKGEGGSTAWADVSTVIPWNMYLVYGDKRILERQYTSMKAWVDYMHNMAGDDNLWTENWHFGDWLAFATTNSDYPGATTEKDLIATAYYSYSSGILAKTARLLGKEDDAANYQNLSDDIKSAFVQEYVTPHGRLVSHTQTAYSMALSFDLLPKDLIPKAAAYLVQDVSKFGHLTTGFVGTPLLCKSLSDNGYSDLAFMLLNRKEYPSWLYPVTQGATTIWERWDGQKTDGTFQDVGMNSFNHYAYGAIGEWLYSYVAGINVDPQNPGYKHIILSPHVGGDLTNASASYNSVYGEIKSDWRIEDHDFVYNVSIPANTTATVVLPKAKGKELLVNSKPVNDEFKARIDSENDQMQIHLGSGGYSFRYPLSD